VRDRREIWAVRFQDEVREADRTDGVPERLSRFERQHAADAEAQTEVAGEQARLLRISGEAVHDPGHLAGLPRLQN